MPAQELRVAANELQRAALAAVDPEAAVHRHVHREGDALFVANRRYDLCDYRRVLVLGGGKAVVPMTTAIADVLGE
jgi:hydroxypyruvate reductase